MLQSYDSSAAQMSDEWADGRWLKSYPGYGSFSKIWFGAKCRFK